MPRLAGEKHQGPLLGSDRAAKGLLEGCSEAGTGRFRSPYKEYYEDFSTVVSLAGMEDAGWTETAVGTAASRSYAYDETQGLLIVNADTVADEGTSIQNNAAGTTSATSQVTNLPGPVVSTATLMDGRELIWATRIGQLIASGTDWSSKLLMGWFVTDTALMTPSTGALAIATGGGIGFHITEAGQLNFVVQGTTSATSTDTGYDMPSLTNATMGNYIDIGFRARWVDASAGTGRVQAYVNGTRVADISGADTALPMQSTQTYSNSIELINGPATADSVDIGVEFIYNAISRAGFTYPYTTALPF
jgi:hypothetical protein